jgi:hypothetical protein
LTFDFRLSTFDLRLAHFRELLGRIRDRYVVLCSRGAMENLHLSLLDPISYGNPVWNPD